MADRRSLVPSTSRPLLDTRPDMDRYLVRPVDALLVDGIHRGLNILLEGPRGSGKTTSLSRLRWLLRQQPNHAKDLVMIRGRLATSTSTFLYLLLEGIGGQPESAPAATEDALVQNATRTSPTSSTVWPPIRTQPDRGIDEVATWRELATTQGALRMLRNRLAHAERPLVFLVDDIDPVLGNQVFGVLRDDLWELDAQWVVTSVDEATQILLEPPADAFFDLTLRMGALTTQQADDLLALRIGKSLPVPSGSWQPRELLRMAATTDPRHWADLSHLRAQQQVEISALGRPASMLAEILRALGPVSPSDERVLNETGWTRSRVSQVLHQLLEAGHVTYAEVPTGRAGRPARLYRLLDPRPPS